MTSKDNIYKTGVALLTVAIFTIGCGGGGSKQKADQGKASTTEGIPAEALNVPPELGGPGFVGEGWQSNDNYEPTGDPNAVVGGTFTTALSEFPATLRNTGKDSNSWFMSLVEGLCYETLMGTHSLTLEFVPGLATHWKISDDKQTYWFRINPKAKFSDGSPVTTKDVIASWKLQTDPGILAPYSNILWGKFDEPVAESPYIIRVHAKELNWKFFLYFGSSLFILPAKYIDIPGSQYLADYQFKIVPGSGMYSVDEGAIVKGRSITLTRRNDYWDIDNPKGKGLYNFGKIKFVVVEDERLDFEKFKKGELDLYYVSRAQWWKEECDFDNVKRGLVAKKKIWNDNPQGVNGLVFNMRKPPFDNPKMRLAFSCLLDIQKMVSQLMYNEYTQEDSYFPGSVYENPNNPKYRYDPDKAVKLLAECGYTKRNSEGWLLDANGKTFELELTFAQPSQERYLTVFQEDLKKVGIKLNLKQTTAATMFKMVNERNYQIEWMSWTGLLFPNPENDVSSWTADPENTNNLSGVKDAFIDSLIKEYNICFDQGKRVEMIRQIDGRLMQIQPFALAWYAPFNRLLFWNKFGYPKEMLTRTADWRGVFASWWIDPEKEKALEAARKDESMKLDAGPVEQTYWIEYDKQHGKSFELKGM